MEKIIEAVEKEYLNKKTVVSQSIQSPCADGFVEDPDLFDNPLMQSTENCRAGKANPEQAKAIEVLVERGVVVRRRAKVQGHTSKGNARHPYETADGYGRSLAPQTPPTYPSPGCGAAATRLRSPRR